MNKKITRLLFTPEEDRIIVERVEQHGFKMAMVLLEKEINRKAKIIKEHYKNTLDSRLVSSFTEEEDKTLLKEVSQIGKKWKTISQIIQTKSPSQLKARYRKLLSKIERGEVDENGSRKNLYIDRKYSVHRRKDIEESLVVEEVNNFDLSEISSLFTDWRESTIAEDSFDIFDDPL